MRIAKYIAHCGVASRRKAEELILNGQISVNGKVINDLSFQIDEIRDHVTCKEKVLTPEKYYYFAVNKPAGYTSSCDDSHAKKLVTELAPNDKAFLRPVGRLDLNSRGLMILTNDTELINKLTHPRYQLNKEYLVKINKNLTTKDVEMLYKGFRAEDGFLKIDFLNKESDNNYKVTISHGKKREIRRLFEHLGIKVIDLKRIKFGIVSLDSLPEGKSRPLTSKEIIGLKE